ncbi:MAG: serine/threonine protein kinase [Deltaproteobacteria bacterium]|nr:serine/threonine protein kinase [Deltaproteobacteria bacterium]
MTESLAWVPWGHEVLEGPWDVGTEQRWRVRLADGRVVVIGQLAPDLASDESIRRRYVRDAERVQGLTAYGLVPTLAVGPEPDPRDPNAIAPWRMRLDPEGDVLEQWLSRAPVTLEELTAVFTPLADALHSVHATGAILRDLRPSNVLRMSDGRIALVDVGLSRVDVLSSHTASSLLMQGSAYAAPEQVHATAVDLRSDLYGLGVMLWQALTGSLPFGDGPAFLRERTPLPALSRFRADVPPALEAMVRACLEEEPARRPATAGDVASVFRGGAPTSLMEQATTVCQHCDTRLRVGQRLCLACGRISVRFFGADETEPRYGIDLLTLDEDAKKLKWLQDFVADTAAKPALVPEFIVGPSHLYADAERARRIRLPTRLFGELRGSTADAIVEVMREQGLDVRIASPLRVRRARNITIGTTIAVVAATTLLAVLGMGPAAVAMFVVGGLLVLLATSRYNTLRGWVTRTLPRYRLRQLPAALPASDPLVARLAALLREGVPGDVRDVVGELALLVQRLVDHRARHVRNPHELDMLTEPVEPLVAAVERLVQQLDAIGRELAELDEGAMVRALAGCAARDDGPERRVPLLQGLDRLRSLEDRRAEVFQRLLEARSLLSRTIELGLAVHDEGMEHERHLALALATLGET